MVQGEQITIWDERCKPITTYKMAETYTELQGEAGLFKLMVKWFLLRFIPTEYKAKGHNNK